MKEQKDTVIFILVFSFMMMIGLVSLIPSSFVCPMNAQQNSLPNNH